jgi:putative membrane protein
MTNGADMQLHNLDIASTRNPSIWLRRLTTVFQVWFFIWFSVGCFVLTFNLSTPFGPFSDFLFHFLAATVLFLHFAARYGGRKTLLAFVWVAVVSGAIELIGEKTGFPFGNYTYSDRFGPQFPATLPLAIPLAWWNIIISLFAICRASLERVPFGPIIEVFLISLFAVAVDLVLEPVATLVRGYWTWYGDGIYYGVPLQNFFGWFGTAFIIGIGLQFILPSGRTPMNGQSFNPQPVVPLLVLMMVIFPITLSAGYNQQWTPLILGLILLGLGMKLFLGALRRSQRDFLS